MTVTVTVETRGHPALVSITTSTEGDDAHNTSVNHEVIPDNTIKAFHLDKMAQVQVHEMKPSAVENLELTNGRPFEGEEVPGAAQNDELIKPVTE